MHFSAIGEGMPIPFYSPAKILKIMKLVAFFLLVFCLHVSAIGLSQKVTLSVKNTPLVKVLESIESQTGVTFIYDRLLLKKSLKVSIEAAGQPYDEVLKAIFIHQPLSYKISDGFIVLSPLPVEPSHIASAMLPAPPITIRVTDAEGKPLAGASVVNKNTKKAGVTNVHGMLGLEVSVGDVIEITYVGFEGQSVIIKDVSAVVSVSLKPSETSLNEVIVNKGYYTEKRRLSTGNVAKVDAEDIENQPVTSLLLALQGRVPGLEITPTSGAAGAAPKIRIRGQSSIRWDAGDPLYIIDGVPIESKALQSGSFNSETIALSGFDPLSSFNPANIERIEILKDADATAIYGSRGANGVIIITTKKGRRGEKTNIDISAYKGAAKMPHKIDLMNGQQYLMMRREAFENAGASPGILDSDLNGDWDTTQSTDWQEVLLGRTASIDDIQANVSGGNENTNFRAGGSFHRETTIYPGDFSFKRGTVHLGVNHHSANRKFNSVLSVNYGANRNKLYNSATFLNAALTLPPVAPKLYDEKGNLNWGVIDLFGSDYETFTNPLAQLKRVHEFEDGNVLLNGNIGYELIQGLIVNANIGFTDVNTKEIILDPLAQWSPGFIFPGSTSSATFSQNKRKSWIFEPQINYHKKWNDHKLDILAGSTWQKSQNNYFSVIGGGYTSDLLLRSLKSAVTTRVTNDDNNEYKYVAAFARIGYNFKDKYLLNLTGRRDGSSRFGPGKRFGNFGAIGAAWIFSDEKILKERLSFLSFGKLRASYGITGSDQIGDYQFYDTYMSAGESYQGAPTLMPTALYNPDFGWESTNKIEAAVELGFLRDIINVQASWYRNRSSNQLIAYRLPVATGFSSVLSNFEATVQNTGWELMMQAAVINHRNLKWVISGNVTFNKNKLVEFPNLENSSYNSQYIVGKTLDLQRLHNWQGVDPQTGEHKVEDLDNDGIIDLQKDKVLKDITGGNFYGGINNTIQFKSLSISFLFQVCKQQKPIYVMQFPHGLYRKNATVDALRRWRKPGDITDIARFTHDYSSEYPYSYAMGSDYVIGDASFVRLKTLSLDYSLPLSLIGKINMEQAKIFIQGQNLFTITDYLGLDPETGSQSVPPLRMITAGVQFKF